MQAFRHTASALALLAVLALPASADGPADRIFVNARFHTVEPARASASAVAVKDGRFVYVGDESGAGEWEGPHTQRIDLGGAMAMPGLIDAHVHAQRAGVKTLFECNFPFSATPEQIAERVATCVEENPDALWIRGGQWNSGFFERYDIESPRAFLDAVSGDKAVLLNDDSYHNGWANSRALALAGIDADTPDPADGTIVRDPDSGEPNGLLMEGAEQAMYEQLPPWSAEQQRAGAREAMRIANRLGITGFKEAAATEAEIAAFHALDSDGAMTAHVATALRTPVDDTAAGFDYGWIERSLGQYEGRYLHTRFVKIFMDGVPTPARTAGMLDPYLPDARGDRSHGMLHFPEARLARDMIELDRRGYTVKIHTAGDRAVRVALNAIESARRANGNSGLRHELAHAGYIAVEDMPRFAELNVVADLSPYLWHPSPIIDAILDTVERERGERYFPIRDLLAAGAPVLAGSDWPAAVETMNPWIGLEAMVTRRDPLDRFPGVFWPEQAIPVEDAIGIFTRDGAAALRLGDETGSIAVGKSADFIVLNHDLLKIAPEAISDTRVLMTVFAGDIVYESADGS